MPVQSDKIYVADVDAQLKGARCNAQRLRRQLELAFGTETDLAVQRRMMHKDVIAESGASPQQGAEAIALPAGIREQEDFNARGGRKTIDQVNEGLVGGDVADESVQRLAMLV
jgi:hypothetical protein